MRFQLVAFLLASLGFPLSIASFAQEARETTYDGGALGAPLTRTARRIPQFTAYPTLGVVPHTVVFTPLAGGPRSTWTWDFGDGTTSTQRSPSHTYTVPGAHDVTLTVAGACGTETRTRVGFVHSAMPTSTPFAAWTLEPTRLPSSNPAVNPKIRVYDLGLNVVHEYADVLTGYGFTEAFKPLSEYRLLGMVYERATGKKIAIEVDVNGAVLWKYDPAPLVPYVDIDRLPNGNTLMLASAAESWPEIHPDPIQNEYILEVTPGGDVVWKWGMAQHWDQLPFTPGERAYLGTFTGSIGAVKWIFHGNSMSVLPANRWEGVDPRFAEGNVLLSLRESSKVFIVDPKTDAIVWSYGATVGQHHPRMIPAGLPGAGNILLFDNGGIAGAPPVLRTYSRLLEIDPTTNEVVWGYEDPATFYSQKMGSVQRLANGNTFFTEGSNGVLKEIDPNGKLLWLQVRSAPKKLFRGLRIGVGWGEQSFKFYW